jgi:hypothetical protein
MQNEGRHLDWVKTTGGPLPHSVTNKLVWSELSM